MPVINENDTTTTDEISFGDNDFLAAQVAILVGAERLLLLTNTDGVFTADPRTQSRRAAGEPDRGDRGARGAADHSSELGARLRRDALEGGRRRDGDRRRDPDGDRQRPDRRHDQRRCARRGGRHDLPRAGRPRLELQAVAEVRQAGARARAGRRRRRAGAARGRHQPAAGRRRRRQRRLRGRRRDRGHVRRRAGRQGHQQLLGRGAAARARAEVGRRYASCCRSRATRRSTATTSCSRRHLCVRSRRLQEPMATASRISRRDLRVRQAGVAHAGDARRRTSRTPRSRRSPTRWSSARRRFSRRMRATSRRDARPASAPRCSTGSRSTGRGSARSPTAPARSRRCPIRSVR